MNVNKTNLLREPAKRKLLFSTGISWLFDAMDVGIISFIVAALAVEWKLGAQQIGLLAAINSLGMAVGALFAGSLADRYGRGWYCLEHLLIFPLLADYLLLPLALLCYVSCVSLLE